MALSPSERDERIREAGSVEAYRLSLLEDILEAVRDDPITTEKRDVAEVVDEAGETVERMSEKQEPASGRLQTVSTYKELPEAGCSAVLLVNPNDDVIRWRLVSEGGRGNEIPPGDDELVNVSSANEVEVRGAETGMVVEWEAFD